MEKHLTLIEAGAASGISPHTLRGYIRSGRLPGFRAGRRLVVREADLRQFMEAGRVNAPTSRGGA
jgi:excisionase family DNA binding protein